MLCCTTHQKTDTHNEAFHLVTSKRKRKSEVCGSVSRTKRANFANKCTLSREESDARKGSLYPTQGEGELEDGGQAVFMELRKQTGWKSKLQFICEGDWCFCAGTRNYHAHFSLSCDFKVLLLCKETLQKNILLF